MACAVFNQDQENIVLKKIIISSIVLNVALLLGRVSGFVRELFIANTYGVTANADIIVLWFTLPDLILSILAGSAVGAALIPKFVRAGMNSKGVWLQATFVFFCIFMIFAAGLQSFSDYIVHLLAPGLRGEAVGLADVGVKIGILLFPLSLLAAVNAAYFHYKGNFFVPGLGTLVFNVVLICGLVLSNFFGGVDLIYMLVALGLAVFARFIYQFFIIFELDACRDAIANWYLDKALFIKFVTSMLSSSLLFVYPVVGRAFSSASMEGGVASFSYTFKLIELPLMVAITFLSVVFMPSLAKLWIDDRTEFFSLSARGLEITLAVSLLVMLPVFIFSDVYARIVFGGILDDATITIMGASVRVGALILVTQGVMLFLSAVFNASGLTYVPLIANVFGVSLYAVLLYSGNSMSVTEIIGLLIISQGLTLICMLVFMFGRWWSDIKNVFSCKWILLILVLAALLLGLDYLWGETNMLFRSSVVSPLYVIFLVGVIWSHPDFRFNLRRVFVKIKGRANRV